MLNIVHYMLIFACTFLTTAALPFAVSSKKDSRLCCQCTINGDESTGCEGLTATTIGDAGGRFISTSGGKFINTYIGGSGAGLMIPSLQIYVPQVQFPSAMNIIPQQQLLYNLQPMQSPFLSIHQSKVSTQCCVPCPDGNGICCCTPGATTTTIPHDSDTLQSSYYSTGAAIPIKSILSLTSIITLLAFENIL
ncbi:Orotidine 5'-phosphate decarboxylase [Dirofilaria immitis]